MDIITTSDFLECWPFSWENSRTTMLQYFSARVNICAWLCAICSDSKVTTTLASHIPITVTSWWVWWRVKIPVSRLFVQQFDQAQVKENIKVPLHWGNPPVTGGFTSQMNSNAENVSIWWRHHGSVIYLNKWAWFCIRLCPICAHWPAS